MDFTDFTSTDFEIIAVITLALLVGRLSGSETRLLLACIIAVLLHPVPYVVGGVVIISLVVKGVDVVRGMM
jgi:hypothetical protein